MFLDIDAAKILGMSEDAIGENMVNRGERRAFKFVNDGNSILFSSNFRHWIKTEKNYSNRMWTPKWNTGYICWNNFVWWWPIYNTSGNI